MLVTVDAVVFLKSNDEPLKVLLIKRKNDPFKGSYALPGGFPEMDELLVDAANRELYEETGLKDIEVKQLFAFDAIDRDPRDRNISITFVGFTNLSNCKLKAGDDASKAQWFAIDNLPPLAFDHESIISKAKKRGYQLD